MKKKFGFISNDRTIISDKIKEAFSSVIPIIVIVLLLCFTITPVDSGMFLAFVFGAILVVVGMGVFTLGADTAMTPIGEYVGSAIIKTKKILLIVSLLFVVGVCITIAEPDLQVLATQLQEIDTWTLIISVGVGVGVFLVIAFLRIVLKIKLSILLVCSYVLVFVLSFFVPENFVPLAFDAGGVTTGPMSVPFIMAIGTGIASLRSDKKAESDGFGLTALCSIGPILAVMILGIIFRPETITAVVEDVGNVSSSRDLMSVFGVNFPKYIVEVSIGLLPVIAFFFLFYIFGGKMGRGEIFRILVGIVYTYFGLVLFLLGVNVGFLPVGHYIGETIGNLPYNWIIVPIGMVLGFFVVAAEPAVHVLTKQVYEITAGAVPKKALRYSLMIGVAVSVGLAMLRIVLHIPIIYILIPGYAIALTLTFIVPEIFTGVAFDSGGVASGAMTASFLLPLALGVCSAVGGNVATEGFGLVAFVAMTPLITIQILGLMYKIKMHKLKKQQVMEISDESEEIIG